MPTVRRCRSSPSPAPPGARCFAASAVIAVVRGTGNNVVPVSTWVDGSAPRPAGQTRQASAPRHRCWWGGRCVCEARHPAIQDGRQVAHPHRRKSAPIRAGRSTGSRSIPMWWARQDPSATEMTGSKVRGRVGWPIGAPVHGRRHIRSRTILQRVDPLAFGRSAGWAAPQSVGGCLRIRGDDALGTAAHRRVRPTICSPLSGSGGQVTRKIHGVTKCTEAKPVARRHRHGGRASGNRNRIPCVANWRRNCGEGKHRNPCTGRQSDGAARRHHAERL